ncbi:MAG: hypothetical protein ACRER2_16425 [Methylococcales bacterium]
MTDLKSNVCPLGMIGLRAGFFLFCMLILMALQMPVARAGATFKIDDTKWISVGLGIKTSFSAAEDQAGLNTNNQWSNNFALNNLRLYVNGQIHKYLKVEFNTECANCGDGGTIRILDAVAKLEYNEYLNLWLGRQLVPEGRIEMNGPFYSATFEPFKTPFEPSDSTIQNVLPGPDAGTFGRDEGANLWGAALDGHLKYVFGVFQGLKRNFNGDKTANADSNFLYATRIAYQFLSVEKAPAYYTGGTAYGGNGDVLTLAGFAQYQGDGAGSKFRPSDILLTGGDLLFEKVLPNNGVVTFNAEYKNFSYSDYTPRSGINYFPVGGFNGPNFSAFRGDSITGNLLYLIPNEVWIGRFQPYIMYTKVMTENGPHQSEYEAGLNYVIDGHNARFSLLWQGGDLSAGGSIWNPAAEGKFTNAIKFGVQLQI